MKKMVKLFVGIVAIIMMVIVGSQIVNAKTGNEEIDLLVSKMEECLNEGIENGDIVMEKFEVVELEDEYVIAFRCYENDELVIIYVLVDEHAEFLTGCGYDGEWFEIDGLLLD